MKYLTKIPVCALAALLLCLSCTDDKTEYGFSLGTDNIEIGPDGGKQNIKITSGGKWEATTDATWVKFAPANGIGPVQCQVQIDSTVLANETRTAIVQVTSNDQAKPLTFRVTQEGYKKFISMNTEPISLPNYGEYGKRKFDVKVTTNVPFEVEIPDEKPWVLCEKIDIAAHLNRGARPRTITLHFTWENNTRPEERDTEIQFVPKEELDEIGELFVKQSAADKIEPGIKGDSLAILACQRTLECSPFDTGDRMANWSGVTLWEETDMEVVENPELLGRVRSVLFQSSNTKEGIPFEIQYLTAAEELRIFSNGNKFLKTFSSGPYISMLTQLKRLQIYSFGLAELDPSFADLKNLEVLDLGNNNFDAIPAILTPQNFPNLTHLEMNSNRRWTVFDMNTTTRPKEEWGGFYKSTTQSNNTALKNLFKWEKLEYLTLSFNYFQYALPDMLREGLPTYKATDEYWYWDPIQRDSVWVPIPQQMVGKPKVLPNMKFLALNHNYMTGKIPDWVLFHPYLMMWNPSMRFFRQEIEFLDEKGNKAGFTNIPDDPQYYYDVYPEQKFEIPE